MDPNESSRFPDFNVVASKIDPNETSRFPGFHYDSNYVNSARGKNCHYQTPRRLLWVGSQRGRCNMGAIEFLIPFFILNDFGARCRVIRWKYSFPYWDLNDFCPPPHQCWRTCAPNAAIASSKINIDEGGGAEIELKRAVLMHFAPTSIAPMFSWFFPTPLRTNP